MRFFLIAFFLLPLPAAAWLTPTELGLAGYDCRAGDLEQCEVIVLNGSNHAADHYFASDAGLAALADLVRSREQSCDDGDERACMELANVLFVSAFVDEPRIFDIYARNCDAGEAFACSRMADVAQALAYSSGPRMLAYYDELGPRCEAGNTTACVSRARLNVLLQVGLPDPAVWRDPLFEACDQHHARACVILSYLYSDSGAEEYAGYDPTLLEPSLAFTNLRRSAEYARKSCDLGHPVGCWNLALSYDYGEGVREDWETAQSFYVQACLGDYTSACEEINYESFWRPGDPADALEAACSDGDFTACLIAVSDQYRADVADPTGPNSAARLEAYAGLIRELCHDGSARACGFYAVRLFNQNDTTGAQRYGTAGCELWDPNSCLALANVLTLRLADEPGNLELSVQFLTLACEDGLDLACNNLGDSFERGLGVAVNPARAQQLYVRACIGNVAIGCKNLGELLAPINSDQSQRAFDRACELDAQYCQ